MAGDVVDDAEADVGEGTDGERDAVAGKAGDQFRVLEAADAVVDALGVEDVEGVGDVGGRALLAGVGDGVEPHGAGAGEDAGKSFRRVAALGGVEADAEDAVALRHRRLKGGEGVVFGEVSEETHD